MVRTKVGINIDNVKDRIEDYSRNAYFTVVDILEKAHFAYAKRDFNGVRIMVDVAEKLVPDEKDEIVDNIRVLIKAMKDRLL